MSNASKALTDLAFSTKVLWIIIGGATCLFVFIFLINPFRQGSNPKSNSSSPAVSSFPIAIGSPDDRQNDDLVQIPAVPPEQGESFRRSNSYLQPRPRSIRQRSKATERWLLVS